MKGLIPLEIRKEIYTCLFLQDWLAPPIENQLRDHGYVLIDPHHTYALHTAIRVLAKNGILTRAQKHNALNRWLKNIQVAPLSATKP